MHQQPLYLEPARADLLAQLAKRTRIPRQSLLREAVDDLLVKWKVLPAVPEPMPIASASGPAEHQDQIDREVAGRAPADL